MEFPLLSVIVPVFKVEGYLDRCVGSILAQSYEHLEVILVDDGSPDGCGGLCDAWAARDSRVRVLHQANGGAGQARNAGLRMASGELIGLVDGDDYIAPEMYAHLYSLMGEDVDIAECRYGLTQGDDMPMDDGSQARVLVLPVEQAMEKHISDELFCQTPPNKLYRRRVVEGVDFPVGKLIDDEFWTYRVIGRARKLAHSSACMYAYRQSPGSAMRRPFSIRRLQGLDAKGERLAFLAERFPGLVEQAKQDLLFTCLMCMQGSLRYLEGGELDAARLKIRETADSLGPVAWSRRAGMKRSALLWMAQRSVEGTARGLNLLEDWKILR